MGRRKHPLLHRRPNRKQPRQNKQHEGAHRARGPIMRRLRNRRLEPQRSLAAAALGVERRGRAAAPATRARRLVARGQSRGGGGGDRGAG